MTTKLAEIYAEFSKNNDNSASDMGTKTDSGTTNGMIPLYYNGSLVIPSIGEKNEPQPTSTNMVPAIPDLNGKLNNTKIPEKPNVQPSGIPDNSNQQDKSLEEILKNVVIDTS